MNDCLFCKISAGEIPSTKIYEDDTVYAFLDITPINRGHTLVIPKKHFRNALAMSEDEFADLNKKVLFLAKKIKEALNADGINISYNNEPAAGQVIFHTHAHIIPRFKNDGFHHWKGAPYENGEEKEVADKIKNAL